MPKNTAYAPVFFKKSTKAGLGQAITEKIGKAPVFSPLRGALAILKKKKVKVKA